MTENTNPANFANRPKEEVQEIASKGGQASHSGALLAWIPTSELVIFVEYFQPPGCIKKSLLLWPEAGQYVHWFAMLPNPYIKARSLA